MGFIVYNLFGIVCYFENSTLNSEIHKKNDPVNHTKNQKKCLIILE